MQVQHSATTLWLSQRTNINHERSQWRIYVLKLCWIVPNIASPHKPMVCSIDAVDASAFSCTQLQVSPGVPEICDLSLASKNGVWTGPDGSQKRPLCLSCAYIIHRLSLKSTHCSTKNSCNLAAWKIIILSEKTANDEKMRRTDGKWLTLLAPNKSQCRILWTHRATPVLRLKWRCTEVTTSSCLMKNLRLATKDTNF